MGMRVAFTGFTGVAVAVLALVCIRQASGTSRGIISLDELTFDRVVDGSRTVLVKFDNKWATSEEFDALAVEVGKAGAPLLLAIVEVEDFEKPDGKLHQWNTLLRDRYQVSPKRYP